MKGIDVTIFDDIGKNLKKIETQHIMNDVVAGGTWEKIADFSLDPEEASHFKLEVSENYHCEKSTNSDQPNQSITQNNSEQDSAQKLNESKQIGGYGKIRVH